MTSVANSAEEKDQKSRLTNNPKFILSHSSTLFSGSNDHHHHLSIVLIVIHIHVIVSHIRMIRKKTKGSELICCAPFCQCLFDDEENNIDYAICYEKQYCAQLSLA
ncbi:hypothetical protein T4B_818 [Trichinella pseudospiralis]|uniref:Uncharacterized protein n=1 Tax=Trichinella pseudospiralis TaxID=6337 RepID=A0A0V1EEN2_TRIPS|nr:hypothetical protein T4A_630 [Trichinella pseudospiralis]KRZ26563.1 hypothetical protein T4B_818 [Trichinella pseudospiralis]KRZ42276.1 hypothetical protein T4C_11841 [Trichinella pseudospiralis]